MDAMIGQTLGQFQVVEPIGKGGMAAVYKAYQPSLNRHVAIKVLPAYFQHEAGFAERFTREARAIARLDHPNILPVYDYGKQDNISYIAMKYVPTGTLHDKLGAPMAPAQALKIIEQVAGALDHAHSQGILHRDIKPSNILLDERGWVYLSDFGLAKMVEGSVQLTGSGVGVGTPAYMSPEQGQGQTVDGRTDVYALGVVLFEMLTGRVPYEAETPMAVVIKHITDPIPLPRRMNPNIPEPVERVLLKALAKNPADRFSTAGQLAAALAQAVQGLAPGLAHAPIAPDPDATLAFVEPRPAARPRPAPPMSPPPSAPAASSGGSVPWLPVAFFGVAVLAGAVCLLGVLFYFWQPQAPPGAVPQFIATHTATAVVVGQQAAATNTATPRPPLPVTPTPSPTSFPTPTAAPAGDTIQPACTPPVCRSDEVYFCPGDCPGGCGTQCVTVTPSPAPDTPTPTFTPTPTLTPSPTSRWTDTGLRPDGKYTKIWATLGQGSSELGYPTTSPVGNRLCARQLFERGYMIWFDSPQDPDPVWAAVIPNDGRNSGAKSTLFTDTWPGEPEYWCKEAEAHQPTGPRRGFGMLWCIYPDLRADIGQAREEEIGGPAYPPCEAQQFQGGAIVHNPLDAKYWVFINNGGWYRFDE
jgi:tRNA A-37 threonylcarbamoyl transferase component Bud32